MKINKKGKIKSKYIENKNNINNNDINIKEKNQINLENNIEIRKISLPKKKNCFISPKRKKLIIKNTESSNNNNNIEEESIYFSFGKIKPEKTNKDKYLESKSNFDLEKNKKNILTEKNFINHENVSPSLNDKNNNKRKKNNIPKPSIKNNNNISSINLDMEKINSTLRNNDFLNIKMNNNNSIMPLTNLFNKCWSNKDEKDIKAIEEFMGKFKNKERSESLQKALNMYKRYKSLSKSNSTNKLNNSCCELKNVKNRLVNQASEQNLLQKQRSEENLIDKKKINKKLIRINYDTKNNNNNNYYYVSNSNKNNIKSNFNMNNSEKKVKKYFLRKVIREEKCYRDKNGNIHVVDYKQSLIKDDKPIFNLKKNLNGKIIKKDLSHKCFNINKISSKKPLDLQNNNKKINVEINQINNIKSYNNINNFSSINNYNNINNKNNEEKNIIYSRNNNPNKLRIINLSKRMVENDLNNKNQNNSKKYQQKIKLVKYAMNNNNKNKLNKLPLDKINYYTVNNANSFQRNFSSQNLYHLRDNYSQYNNNDQSLYYLKNSHLVNNQFKIITKRNYDFPKNNNNTDNFDKLNENYEINNIYYKENKYPETDRTLALNRNNSNCSFYESKSLSNNKNKKILKNSNSYIIFKRNGEYEIDYIKDKTYNYNNESNNNNYNEININQNNLFNKKLISNNYYNNNNYNNNSNNYVNYYETNKTVYYN